MVLESLTLATFTGREGERFRIGGEGDVAPFDTELIEVTQAGQAPAGGGRAPFSLVFRSAPDHQALPQRIYRVEHAELGALDIFLVPIGADASGMRYQAVFS